MYVTVLEVMTTVMYFFSRMVKKDVLLGPCGDDIESRDHPCGLFLQLGSMGMPLQSNATYPTTSGPGPCWITEYVG